jgi:hypothetical protein
MGRSILADMFADRSTVWAFVLVGNVANWQQIIEYLRRVNQTMRVEAAHLPTLAAVVLERFEILPVEFRIADLQQRVADFERLSHFVASGGVEFRMRSPPWYMPDYSQPPGGVRQQQ